MSAPPPGQAPDVSIGQLHFPRRELTDKPKGPPYASRIATLGETPSTDVDVPVSAVLIFLFVLGAAFHMTVFQINLRRRGHKFVPSAMVFGLCMARITANSLRIAVAAHPSNISLTIAANIFANLGVIILFIVNLIFAQRVLRAYHPHFGWTGVVKWAYRALWACIGAIVPMIIVAVVYTNYTLDVGVLGQLRDVQLFSTTFLNVVVLLPIPITLLSILIPRAAGAEVDKFGKRGSMRTSVGLLLFTSTLLLLGACLRTAASYKVELRGQATWIHSKALYYCANYMIEIICVYLYGLTRFDQRFWIPNGSSAPGDYSRPRETERSDVEAGTASSTETKRGYTTEEDARKEVASQP